ncbi:MAG: DUF1127 domain-containing protein [Gammaproteobacteria bacterium]|nr:DUF1127 domain-containing protein [Gammaproteobacteria bacterium]
MKSFQFAVASIIDANTGNGLAHSGGRIDYTAGERQGRRIRANTVAALISLIRGRISSAISNLGERASQRQALAQLSRLDDRLLRDIGLTRGDLVDVERGHTTLAELSPVHRTEDTDKAVMRTVPDQIQRIKAVNQPSYVEEKCA